jgi:hypothetical protein
MNRARDGAISAEAHAFTPDYGLDPTIAGRFIAHNLLTPESFSRGEEP